MNRRFLDVLAVSIVSSAIALAAVSLLHPEPAFARQGTSVGPGMILYASHRKDTDNHQGFIFFDPKSGDIWVYDDQNPKEHYRVAQMGQPLEKLK